MRNVLLIMTATFMLLSCATDRSAQKSFAEIYNDYNKYLRWGEFDQLSLYVSESIYDEFRKRVKDLKDVRVVDIRELKMDYDEIHGKAEVDVEIDYYYPSSLQLRTIEDTQQWVYIKEDGVLIWRLETLPPEFK